MLRTNTYLQERFLGSALTGNGYLIGPLVWQLG